LRGAIIIPLKEHACPPWEKRKPNWPAIRRWSSFSDHLLTSAFWYGVKVYPETLLVLSIFLPGH